ncbi:MAG: hypothetical protein M3Y72_16210 [Acidobacteriota bacterium]|nr:hypothetical protein [Acidobacteriota bacterium]
MLHTLSFWALVLSGLSFVVIASDLMFHRQRMMIMNFVWPVTALYFGPFALWSYFGFGRQKRSEEHKDSERRQTAKKSGRSGRRCESETRICGARCTLGDTVEESAMFLTGFTLFGSKLVGSYLWDFVRAYLLGSHLSIILTCSHAEHLGMARNLGSDQSRRNLAHCL